MMRLRKIFIGILATLVIAGAPLVALADEPYGAGDYGACEYGSCSLSLETSGTVELNITPTSTATCTVDKDEVVVTTASSVGYTLTIADSDTSSNLVGSNGGTITPVSGSGASPAALSSNKWGYRVDGVLGFGSGPTSAVSNTGVPALNFAAMPISSATADTIRTTSAAAASGETTNVWYGICSNVSIPAGLYTDNVTYTAVVN